MALTVQEAIDELEQIAEHSPDAQLTVMYKDQKSKGITYDGELNVATLVR